MARALKECSSCLQRFESHYSYCPYCGQKSNEQLTLNVLFNNTLRNYFSVDARFFKSLLPLIFKPGYVAKRFVEGRRMVYLHPAQMYLFVSVIFFFLFSFISRDQQAGLDNALKKDMQHNKTFRDSLMTPPLEMVGKDSIIQAAKIQASTETTHLGTKTDSAVNAHSADANSFFNINFSDTEIDSLITSGTPDDKIYDYMGMKPTDGFLKKRIYKQSLKFLKEKSGGSVLQAFYDSVPLAMFFLLPIFALLLKLFYFRKGTFARHLVFTFYFFAFLFIVFGLLVIASLLWNDFPSSITLFFCVGIWVHFLLSLKRFYQQSYVRSFIKGMAISFIFMSFVAPLAVIIMGTMAFLFY